MNKYITYILIITNIIDYYKYYKESNNRYCDKWGESQVFYENNPKLNNIIYQPINTFTNIFYYILNNIYEKENTEFDLMQKVSINILADGSAFMHGSFTDYGGFIDVLGMIYYFFSFILKDLKKFGKLNNKDILKYLPYFMLIFRFFGRYLANNCYDITFLKNLKLFKILVGLKITGEIKKHLNNNFLLNNSIWCIFASCFVLNNEENIIKSFLERTGNVISLSGNLLDTPWIIIFIYGLFINNVSKEKAKSDKKKEKLIYGFIIIIIAFYFQEGEFNKETINNPESIFQYHALWHILSASGLWLIDKYLLANL